MTHSGSEPIAVPFGAYKPWVRHGDLLYISGLTPRVNSEMLFPGQVGVDVSIPEAGKAAAVVVGRILTCMREATGDLDSIARILTLNVYVASSSEFGDHSKVADFVSHGLMEQLGERAIGARAAIGVVSLPGNAPIEVMTVVALNIQAAD